MKRYMSRKFLLAVLGVALATWLRHETLLDGQQWVQALTLCLGSYMAGNMGDTFASAKQQ